MKNIIGVRFKKLGKIYFFNPKMLRVRKGDKVIVETAQGEEYGEVVIPNRYVEDEKIVEPLKKVIRIANYRDHKHFEECKKMIDDVIAEFGRIDVLVNNAGITRDNLLMKMSEEDFDAVIGINLKGAFNTRKHVSKYQRKSGKIINISSVSGILGNAGQANYSASKAGVIGLTKSTARELASRGITCNAIAPGFIETDMTSAMNEQVIEKSIELIPLKRIGKAEEIADLAAFLASDKADYITGQVFAVDGGMTI